MVNLSIYVQEIHFSTTTKNATQDMHITIAMGSCFHIWPFITILANVNSNMGADIMKMGAATITESVTWSHNLLLQLQTHQTISSPPTIILPIPHSI